MAKKSVLCVCMAIVCRYLDTTRFDAPHTDVANTSVCDRVMSRTILWMVLVVVASVWGESIIRFEVSGGRWGSRLLDI